MSPKVRLAIVLAVILVVGVVGLQLTNKNDYDPASPTPTLTATDTLDILAFLPVYPEGNAIEVNGVSREDVSFDLSIYTDGVDIFGRVTGIYPADLEGEVCFTPNQNLPIAGIALGDKRSSVILSQGKQYCFPQDTFVRFLPS